MTQEKKTSYWNNEKQDNFKADFGFLPPKRTKTKCKYPVFYDKYLHRIAIMKDEHIGSKSDRDEGGIPGFISKFICTGCGKRYTINRHRSYFHPDVKTKNLQL